MSEVKRCWKCKSQKPVTDFHRRAKSSDGLQKICKDCQREVNRERDRKLTADQNYAPEKSQVCSKCNVEKPVTEFGKQKNGRYGVKKVCKNCHEFFYRVLVGERNKKNWVRPTEGMKRCPDCRETLSVMSFASDRKRADGLQSKCNVCNNARRKTVRLKRRMQVLEHYSDGACCCQCCGERTIEFLSIDHIDGGGLQHRKEIGTGSEALYAWLIRENFPSGFRVLCHNCNQALGHYGYCPHQREREEKLTCPTTTYAIQLPFPSVSAILG